MTRRAFTLVEILIVVVMLGILASVVLPQFAGASDQARESATYHEVQKIRRAISVYGALNSGRLPTVTAGDGTWGELVTADYLREPPINPYVGGVNRKVIAIDSMADVAYQQTHGWVYDDTDGDVWAGSFDANDEPLPRP